MTTRISTAFKNYYRLAKPGIVYGNVFTTIAAYLFASRWHIDPWLFFTTVFGMGFVIAAACVANNILDRDMDAKMARTKERQMVTHAVPLHGAVFYASFMFGFGEALLFRVGNPLTAGIALVGFIFYVALYTPAKRRTPWAALIGTVPGAIPMVAGYVAVTGRLDLTALILFLAMVFWQLPHFYGIAIRRREEYAAASVPTLPNAHGVRTTKWHMFAGIILFGIAACSLTFVSRTGYVYFAALLLVSALWLRRALAGWHTESAAAPSSATTDWARGVFLFSLIVLCVFCGALAAAPLLP